MTGERRVALATAGVVVLACAAVGLSAPAAHAQAPSVGAPTAATLALTRPALPSDFNGDGIADLAVTAPWDDYDGHAWTPGGVHIFYGQPAGGSALPNQFLTPKASGLDLPRAGLLGVSVASGDFDRDGYADLAMGAPSYDLPGEPANCGAVVVVYGTAHGLDPDAKPNLQVWTQDSAGVKGAAESDDSLGTSLAAGDFDGDGYVDLAAGAEGETLGPGDKQQGAVTVLYGSAKGLTAAGDQMWSQDSPGIKDHAEVNDHAARSLAAGDFDGDGVADLAIGVDEGIDGRKQAGAVNVIYGVRGHGLGAVGDRFYSQDTDGIAGGAEKGDSFGATLAAGDTDGDGRDELVVAAPDETIDDDWRAGMITVIPGTASGLKADRSVSWTTRRIGATAANGNFGRALAFGNVDGDGYEDVAAGAPLATEDGYVYVLKGSAQGLTNERVWILTGDEVDSTTRHSDLFGAALWLGPADTSPGDDLLVGDPFATFDLDSGHSVSAGAAYVFASDGTDPGVTPEVLHEGVAGVAGTREKGDRFGNGFPGSSYPW